MTSLLIVIIYLFKTSSYTMYKVAIVVAFHFKTLWWQNLWHLLQDLWWNLTKRGFIQYI